MVRVPRPRASALLLVASLLGCSGGSRPPGLADDFGFDAGPQDVLVPVVRDAVPQREVATCGGTAMSLTRRQASAILVIDRSGSMAQDTLDHVIKWNALLAALTTALPRIEPNVSLGLVIFPQGDSRGGGDVCGLRATLDLEPALNNAAAIMRRLRATLPDGPTPTAAAEQVAGQWFVDNPDRGGARYVILATDGAPNCNGALDPATCTCSGSGALCDPARNSFANINCLDDTRAVASIQGFRNRGIFTYVVGLNGAEAFSNILDSMADAGGRARAATPRYYPANTAPDLARELSNITSGIVDCRFALDAAPPDPTLVDVRLDGASLVHDTNHANGWDWSDDTHREIRFYGMTCDVVSAATGGSRLVAAYGCPALAPP